MDCAYRGGLRRNSVKILWDLSICNQDLPRNYIAFCRYFETWSFAIHQNENKIYRFPWYIATCLFTIRIFLVPMSLFDDTLRLSVLLLPIAEIYQQVSLFHQYFKTIDLIILKLWCKGYQKNNIKQCIIQISFWNVSP